MSILIITVDGKHAPFAYCDHCGKQLTDAPNDRVLFVPDGLLEHPELSEYFQDGKGIPRFAHRKCVSEMDKKYKTPDGGQLDWMPLNDFLIHLKTNSKCSDTPIMPDLDLE